MSEQKLNKVIVLAFENMTVQKNLFFLLSTRRHVPTGSKKEWMAFTFRI